MLGHLGNEANGVWLLIGSVIAYFGLLDLGVTASITKMVAESKAERKFSGEIVRNGFYLFSVIGFMIIGLGLLLLPFINPLFNVQGSLTQETNTAYAVVLLAVGLTFASSILSATFAGHQDYRTHNIFIILQAIINAAGTVLVLEMGYGIVGLALVGLATAITIFIFKLIAVRKLYGISLPGRIRLNKNLMKEIFTFSKWVFVMNIAVQVVFYTDNIVLGAFSTLTAITFYQVALKPNNFLRTISGQLLTVVMPASAYLKADQDHERMGRLLLEATRITSVILMPFVIVLVVWGRDLIDIWVGQEYQDSYATLIVLAVGIFATSLAGASSQILLALDRPKFLAKIAIIEAVANLVLSIALVKPLGILGVAIGTTLPTVVASIVIAMPYAARLVKVGTLRLFRKMIEPIVIGIAYIGFVLIFLPWLKPSNFLIFIALSATVFFTYVGFAILFDKQERHIYLNLIRKAVRL